MGEGQEDGTAGVRPPRGRTESCKQLKRAHLRAWAHLSEKGCHHGDRGWGTRESPCGIGSMQGTAHAPWLHPQTRKHCTRFWNGHGGREGWGAPSSCPAPPRHPEAQDRAGCPSGLGSKVPRTLAGPYCTLSRPLPGQSPKSHWPWRKQKK